MTSSALRERSARPCSPSAQRSASARLLLPEPFGPTTALMPGPNSTFVRSANDLKPWSRRASRRGSARARCAGHADDPQCRRRRCADPRSSQIAPAPAAAAAVSAVAARRALADAQQLAVDPDLDPERLLVVGPGRVDEPVRRAGSPVRRWVYSWSRLLGLFSAPIGASADSSGSASSTSQSRTGVEAEVEVERAGHGLERRREERRAAAAAALRLALAEQQDSPRSMPAGQPGEARSSTRSRRGGRTGRPRRRRDGGRTAPRRWPG